MNISTEINVGIDTGKHQLDIYIRPIGDYFTVENNEKGIKEAVKRIKKHAPTRIIIEATGRLEMPFACAATKANLPIVIAHCYQVHNFAVSTGKLDKTDKLDAAMIAHYGEALKPRLSEIKADNIQKISDLLTCRSQLIDMRTIKHLQKEIAWVEACLDKLIENTPDWKRTFEH